MTSVEIIAYVVVPLMGMIGFPSLVMLVVFCFKISGKVTKLESDYSHLDKNLKQGFMGFQTQLDSLTKDVKIILEYVNQQKGGRRKEDQDHE